MNVEEIKTMLEKGKIEEVLEKFDWQSFEIFVAEIFIANDFRVERNFRFKTGRRYEIDLVAIRSNTVICADCKHWSRGRHKKSGLKHAVAEQERRLEEFKKIRKNLKNCRFYPLIITLFEEEIVKEGRTFVVPVWKLNNFLCNLERYLEL
jgi:Holliday junction resolvase-like predicted endonuclease